MRSLYGIMDNVAGVLVGDVVSERAEAAAIRSFHDLLVDARTQLAKHPQDYSLLHLGVINEVGEIQPDLRVAATGASWLEYQSRKEGTT